MPLTVSPPTDNIATGRPAGVPAEAEILGRMAGENFPVASALLGPRLRGQLVALYGWARLVDQLGDDYAGDRLAALDWVDAELTRALNDAERPGDPPARPPGRPPRG